jgi:hypothetical protein
VRLRLLAVALVALASLPACAVQTTGAPRAGRDPECLPERLILVAQSVPSAQLVPCIGAYPAGWTFERMEVHRGRTQFSLASDRSGAAAVTVLLTDRCDTEGATEIQSDEPRTRRFERIEEAVARYVGERYYLFEGGCTTYQFDLDVRNERLALANEATSALTFMPRGEVAAHVAAYSDGRLRLD